MRRLECEGCWEKQGGGFDVLTDHIFDVETSTAKCTICGTVQDIEII